MPNIPGTTNLYYGIKLIKEYTDPRRYSLQLRVEFKPADQSISPIIGDDEVEVPEVGSSYRIVQDSSSSYLRVSSNVSKLSDRQSQTDTQNKEESNDRIIIKNESGNVKHEESFESNNTLKISTKNFSEGKYIFKIYLKGGYAK